MDAAPTQNPTDPTRDPAPNPVTDPFAGAETAPSTSATSEATSAGDLPLDVESLNSAFEAVEPTKIVDWAAATFGDELIMTSSFGAESALLLHMATRALPGIRIVMVDTGYLFPETHLFMEQLRQRLNLNVWIYRTANDPIHYLRTAGEENPNWRNDVDRCCAANKNEPLSRAMKQIKPKAWLRGIRRDQAQTRKHRSFIEWSRRDNCWAISPLLNMTSKSIFAYMKQHDLPYHPLYEKGYPSIGCNPISCTRPIAAGDDPRSGRWTGKGKIECGINVTDSLDSSAL
jgi:phosphoadenosine phosphosulfate reductase